MCESVYRGLCLQKDALTMVRGTETLCQSPSPVEAVDLTAFLAQNRSRTISLNSHLSELSERTEEEDDELDDEEDEMMSRSFSGGHMDEPMVVGSPLSPIQLLQRRTRGRFVSESEMSDDSLPGTLTEVRCCEWALLS